MFCLCEWCKAILTTNPRWRSELPHFSNFLNKSPVIQHDIDISTMVNLSYSIERSTRGNTVNLEDIDLLYPEMEWLANDERD